VDVADLMNALTTVASRRIGHRSNGFQELGSRSAFGR
jgi:hypothetical protein